MRTQMAIDMTCADPQAPPDEVELLTSPPHRRGRDWLIRLLSITFILGGWELAGREVNPLLMSYPSAIASATSAMIVSGDLQTALLSSLKTLLIGFTIASLIGSVLGLLIGRYKAFDAATDWLVNALYATPMIAIIPLVILWFGLGDLSKLFIVSLITLFPVLINTSAGVRNVPAPMMELATAFNASEWQIFSRIILPASLPFMMTGLRLGIGRAIIAMVAAEFFTSITGLGALIVKFGNQYDTASMFVPILVLMIMGISLTAIIRRVENYFLPWRRHENE